MVGGEELWLSCMWLTQPSDGASSSVITATVPHNNATMATHCKQHRPLWTTFRISFIAPTVLLTFLCQEQVVQADTPQGGLPPPFGQP
ncbi:hypothetical protein BDV33DRAFT_183084 [Aspergillus novoparasiticus]|uniref:Uncharacterized protein n=1 Tax=Aspergillus novoparasiticus TaxID=986946 RepID=A0A5N6EBU4_9EURO|nr:hypothetical protein BDV33DRAFT_183084 [Aspergillus novoparasiticus]